PDRRRRIERPVFECPAGLRYSEPLGFLWERKIMATATLVHPESSTASQPSPFVSGVKPPEPFTLVLFGATGDLAGRKLLPALSNLLKSRYLPRDFAIVGIGRRDKTDQAFRDDVSKSLAEFRKGTSVEDAAD